MVQQMMPREGTVIADRYRLERKVGGGRVSAVWRVRDEISGRACAIKLLHRSMHKHPEALTRFSLEDRLARELSGPHFPERVGSGVWDGLRYIAWRWHDGESLRALFERNPKQDAPTVHSIVQETCQALALVHAAGYVHGDLKPENIFFADRDVSERGRQVKLLGFGVASRLARASAAGYGVGRRRAGEIVGTPLYLSPDLILGRVPNGGQADLWALAVIVYEALTGRAPFLGNDLGAVLQAILEKRAPRPSSVADNLPGSFDAWWAQALAQEFDTPSEFAGALARALAPALRSSHTQRSASLPERPPAALEMTPMPASPPASPVVAPPAAAGAAAQALPQAALSSPPLSAAVPASLVTGAAANVAASVAAAPAASAAAAHPAPAAPPPAAPGAGAPGNPQPWTRPNASTATGIGPAEPPPPRPPAPSDPALRAEGGAHRHGMPAEAHAHDEDAGKFAPLPLPLRDLSADVSRKTLVGITPPAHRPGGHPPQAPAQAPSAQRAGAARPTRSAIAGTPIRPIETRDPRSTDTGDIDPFRRPAHPTVPFPRPRVAPRNPGYTPTADELPDLGRTWQGTSTRTLRFVLTSRDHKPQRIAAALVCAAAALVIFVVGRSPISGTANIGQTTESLSAEPGQKAAGGSLMADPSRSELAVASGSEPSGTSSRPDVVAPAEPPPRAGVEIAPGLLSPPGLSRGPSDIERALAPSGGGSAAAGAAPPSPAPPNARASTTIGDAAVPSSTSPPLTPPRAKPAPRKAPSPPQPPPAPAPQRKPNGELDFGI
jgi:eukaryotic-like serine/threonine-protein kinase